MKQEQRYYKESGELGLSGLPLMAIFGLVAAAAIGFLYAYATNLIPIIYFNVILTAIFGVAIGWLVTLGAKLGKVRHRRARALMGLVCGILGVYFAWVFWLSAASEGAIMPFNPADIWLLMTALAEIGAWSISDFTPTGILLWLVWFLEAAIIIVASTMLAAMQAGDTPFCEHCQRWTKLHQLPGAAEAIVDQHGFVQAMENAEYHVLTDLGRVPANAQYRTSVELYSCPTCDNAHFLKVNNVVVTVNSEGKLEAEETPLFDGLIVPRQAVNEIKAWSQPT